jgi:hypothetical protein
MIKSTKSTANPVYYPVAMLFSLIVALPIFFITWGWLALEGMNLLSYLISVLSFPVDSIILTQDYVLAECEMIEELIRVTEPRHIVIGGLNEMGLSGISMEEYFTTINNGLSLTSNAQVSCSSAKSGLLLDSEMSAAMSMLSDSLEYNLNLIKPEFREELMRTTLHNLR